ncbi:protein NRT1/ PTR FAMILY 5.10-like isoform X1 [Carex rostrata]
MELDLDSDLFLPSSQPESMLEFVNSKGQPATRSTTGGWTSAFFIVGIEVAEKFAIYGISANLITYLTGPLGEGTATAASQLNTWSGVTTMLPLLGAFIADSWLGRYRTVVYASLLYVLGLGMLTVSSIIPSPSNRHSSFQKPLFFFSLYFLAFAQGGHKPCVQAFGADQFDQNDLQERLSKNSFFNWWYFSICVSFSVAVVTMSYVQDNISWGLGFGIPCGIMVLGLILFLLGTRTYRYFVLEKENPFIRVRRSFVALARSWKSKGSCLVRETGDVNRLPDEDNTEPSAEEAKGLLRLFPIWATCVIYGVVFAQSSTLFTKQASTLDRRIGKNFQVPPAALQVFSSIAIICFIPVYDKLLVPLTRKFTGIPSGITMLQRIGTGMVLSLLAVVVAALVEIKRLNTAKEYGLVDKPKAPIPMSVWWMVPQYALFGMADVFTIVGLQEFFYDQVPDALHSLGLAFCPSVLGVGSFTSSFLISVIDKISSKNGKSWFSNNLNQAHLDYFYWFLAGLTGFEIVLFLYFSKIYVYRKKLCTYADV